MLTVVPNEFMNGLVNYSPLPPPKKMLKLLITLICMGEKSHFHYTSLLKIVVVDFFFILILCMCQPSCQFTDLPSVSLPPLQQ